MVARSHLPNPLLSVEGIVNLLILDSLPPQAGDFSLPVLLGQKTNSFDVDVFA